jgi:hypothetical protein
MLLRSFSSSQIWAHRQCRPRQHLSSTLSALLLQHRRTKGLLCLFSPAREGARCAVLPWGLTVRVPRCVCVQSTRVLALTCGARTTGGTIISRSDVLRGQSWEVAKCVLWGRETRVCAAVRSRAALLLLLRSSDDSRSTRGGQVGTSYRHRRETADARCAAGACGSACGASKARALPHLTHDA